MTLNNFEGLKKWFFANQRDDKPSPHWTLYGGSWGEKEVRLMQNNKIDSPDKSMEFLAESIRMMNNPDGTKFRILLYPVNSPNNYTATAHVQIFENSAAPVGRNLPATAGIGNLPGMMGGDLNAYIDEKVELQLLKKENEQLKGGAGSETIWERILGIIADSPHLSAAVGNLANAIVTKVDPSMAGRLMQAAQPVNGVPGNNAPDDDDISTPEDAQIVFINNINAVTAALGVDAATLAKRLNQVVQQNPAVARQILNMTTNDPQPGQ